VLPLRDRIAIAFGILGVVVAIVIMLFPLAPVKAFGTTTGYCGPGFSSSPALVVLFDRNVVNSGPPALASQQTGADKADFAEYCFDQAKSRAWVAGGAGVGVWAMGACVLFFVPSEEERKRTR
jgi:hypothetical protein